VPGRLVDPDVARLDVAENAIAVRRSRVKTLAVSPYSTLLADGQRLVVVGERDRG